MIQFASLRISFCQFALLALAVTSASAQSSPRSLVGDWSGTYVCAQGSTGLTLSIEKQTGEIFSGYFHFYPPRDNPVAKEGCFSVQGRVDANGRVSVTARSWITQPEGYVTVDLDGSLDAAGRAMSGFVEAPAYVQASCRRFALSRKNSRPSVANMCRESIARAVLPPVP